MTMKMSPIVTVCCVAVLLSLTSVSAVRRLKSINALKKINSGQSVPEESLRLLHWFANIVDIDNNNVIWLTFDPDNQDYGSHQYHNSEGLLDPLPEGQRYYTIGNLNQDGSEELPDYVVNRMDNMRSNMARVIIRVREESRGRRIDQVFITQHYGMYDYRRRWYDPDHTYQVTMNLLRQIRALSVAEIRNNYGNNVDNSQLREICKTWGRLVSLGLLLFIVNPEKYLTKYPKRIQSAPGRNAQPAVAPGRNAQPAVAPGRNAQPAVAPGRNAQPAVAPGRNAQPDFAVTIPNIPENISTDRHDSANVRKRIGFGLCATLFLITIVVLIIYFLIFRQTK